MGAAGLWLNGSASVHSDLFWRWLTLPSCLPDSHNQTASFHPPAPQTASIACAEGEKRQATLLAQMKLNSETIYRNTLSALN